MSSSYIYAGTKATTLKRTLLTNDQLEILLAGENFEAGYQSLHETFMGPYIARKKDSELSKALEEVISDTKDLLNSIAPNKELLDILWLKYDYYNLQAIIKGEKIVLSNEEIENRCFTSGKFSPQKLLEKYQQGKLSQLDKNIDKAFKSLGKNPRSSEISSITNYYYFISIKQISDKYKDKFIDQYVKLLIDNHNLVSGLRYFAHRTDEQNPSPIYVPGGNFNQKDLQKPESIIEKLSKLGSDSEDWKEAISTYEKNNSYTELEKVLDDRISKFLKQESRNIFSPAPLFAYFQAKKNNVQLIRMILIGKKTGLSEYEIKKMLRKRFE